MKAKNKVMKVLCACTTLLLINIGSLYSQTEIKNLYVEYQKNPIGIDVDRPRFSWKMESDRRNVSQTAYVITVSTDAAGENPLWNSGQVVSDKSVSIPYDGPVLSPATRYYWKVDVWDNQGQKTTSTENAFFEMGLMNSGWNGAQWIKVPGALPENEDLSALTQYAIEMDFEIADIAAGPVFGAKDKGNNFFMWQINIYNAPGKTLLRPHSWQNGSPACHAEIDITDLISVQAGQTYRLRIAIDGDKASTYINGILVDENRTNPRGGNYGYGAVGIGFRADRNEQYVAERAYYDNVTVQIEKDGQEENLFTETFSDPENFSFSWGTVENGRLYMIGVTNSDPHHLSWQQDRSAGNRRFTLEADMTLINDNASIIFSATGISHFYMWSFNTYDDANQPLLRRHYNNGSWSVSDAGIGAFFSKDDLRNRERRIKIEVAGNQIKTYIDNQLVDTWTDTYGQLTPGAIGFRAYKGTGLDEIALWDNIVLTDYSGETPVVVFSEDFETGNNPFDNGEIEVVVDNAKFRIFSEKDETRAFDDSLNGTPMFRTEFALDKEIQSARIYTSGLGVYDVFINGQRVGTPTENGGMIYDELKPGWTDYRKTIFYSTYDVTVLLTAGPNAIGASVASGWWNGAIAHGVYGNGALGFLAQLQIEFIDGTKAVIVTDPATWRCSTNGALRAGDIYHGETYDARKESEWTHPGFNDAAWLQSALNTDFHGEITAFVGPAVQVRSELQRTPVWIVKYEGVTATGTTYGMVNTKETHDAPAVVQLNKGQTAVYDMGQNMTGWVKFRVKGAAGTKLTLRFAEMLNDDGAASRGNDGAGGSLYRVALRSAKATLYYTLKGDPHGEEFHPSATFFGFRYCDVTATGNIEIESLTGEVVGTAAEEGSSFTSSNTRINQLYSNIVWGQRSNFLSVPTDCPQRDERLGWTGDIQIFGRTATYNADLAAFFRKWMGDMRDGQRSDGAYGCVAPYTWEVGYGRAAWSEAGLVIPWNVYLMYNDTAIIEENFESMEGYMDFLASQAGDGYLYNGAGTMYADWVAYVPTDGRFISVCYYACAARLMEKMAKVLSKTEGDGYAQKALAYQTLYNNIKAEFNSRYVTSRGALKEDTQAAYLLALKFDLFASDENRQKGIARLKELIETNGNRLNTGFVGTGVLNQTLSEVGLTDVAYNLLLQRNNPSWLYSVDQGATTIWERWNSYTMESGFGDVNMNSFNHYAYGAVGEWMFAHLAGINPDESNPGFKHILLNPQPDFRKTIPAGQERLTQADVSCRSYYGTVRSAWKIEAQKVTYEFTIPANTTATLTLLLNDGESVYEGATLVSEAEGVGSFRIEDKKAIIELQSGVYAFEVRKADGSAVRKISEEPHVRIYPNPVRETLNFQHAGRITHIQIFNDQGLLVYSQRYGAPVAMHSFTSGVYFVQVDTKGKTEWMKVIKV